MFGLVEVITLLLGLSGFGLSPNPKPATADVALQYAIPEADVVIHVDVASIVPGNYKNLLALPNQPQIKSSPELLKAVRQVVTEIEGARSLAKATTGIDLSTDITDATAFISFVPQKEPAFIAVVRGKLTLSAIDKIAGMTGKQATTVGSGKLIDMGGNEPSIGMTKDGVLLAGTPALVRQRLNDGWRAPPRGAGANLSYAAMAIDAKPVFAVSVALSNAARKEVASKLGPKKNFITDLAARHKSWTVSAFHDGVGWSWVDTNKAGLDQVAQMSEGFVDLMRAAHIAPRGIAKMLLAAIDSYKGTDRRVDEVIKRKADIWKIVESYTGDGNFKVAVNKDPAKLRLDVRATGKSLADVLPAGLLAPLGMVTMFGMRSGNAAVGTPYETKPAIAVPPPPPPKAPVQPKPKK
ncbi:MAG: hypothetical protein H0V17_04585 [Deltaproteobacteria bacterium]|nr:hypothetical protein [Deltaproteobacteria bacterium]